MINIPDSDKSIKKFSDDVIKHIKAESAFWTTIIEFIMEFKDTKIFQWINRHPTLALTIVIIWGLTIMGTFFTFIILIILK